MTSNQLFMYLAPRCLIMALSINAIIAVLCFLGHWKAKKLKYYWRDLRYAIIGIDIITFTIMFFLPKPTIVRQETNLLPTEEIVVVNKIEHENIIEIPSIVLPLQPEGEQAIVIDTSSESLKDFMRDFYGENVEFFNQRQKATFLSSRDGFQNFTSLDLNDIQYKNETETTVNLDQLGYDTIWLFTDLRNIQLEATNCKVMLYVPRMITEIELEYLKELGDITVITIEKN